MPGSAEQNPGLPSAPVVDAAYGERRLAALYDALNPWGPPDDFCLDHIMRAGSVLDAGATIFRSQATGEVVVSPATLHFADPDHLHSLLAAAGFAVDGWFGDWDRSEVTPASREIIVIAARP